MEQNASTSKLLSSKLIGNILIAVSLVSLFFLFYPLFMAYFFPPQIKTESFPQGTFITIPKIHAQAPIVENVDPWTEKAYQDALKKGVAHAKDTALPGEKGRMFLFAHSSGQPWEQLRYNTIFLRLGELKKGDIVIISRNGKTFHYTVNRSKEVWPTEISYLEKGNKEELVLQTCTPIGTSLKRLLVFAEPKIN